MCIRSLAANMEKTAQTWWVIRAKKKQIWNRLKNKKFHTLVFIFQLYCISGRHHSISHYLQWAFLLFNLQRVQINCIHYTEVVVDQYDNTTIPWFYDPMISWSYDSTTPWFHDPMILWSHDFMTPWLHDPIIPSSHDSMSPWSQYNDSISNTNINARFIFY